MLAEKPGLSQQGASIDGAGSPRLITEFEEPLPLVSLPATGQGPLPRASFPFNFRNGRFQAFHLPNDPHPKSTPTPFKLATTIGDFHLEWVQENCVPRPPETLGESESGNEAGQLADQWVGWQINAFQELGRIPDNPFDFDADTRSGCVRRSWGAAQGAWFRDGRDEAQMALIVRLGSDRKLIRAISSISQNPRRVLERFRENTPVGRIQELDPACIYDYARRPGVTTAQKAGTRQSLLAVKRREFFNTVENLVSRWVMERCELRAREYTRQNRAFNGTSRVRDVASFARRNRGWRLAESFSSVKLLRSPVSTPNYPLQFEKRYNIIWKAYLQLRREKWIIDDAWAWHRMIWSETSRQLFYSFLHSNYKTHGESCTYYRQESRYGSWTEPPAAPGPFIINKKRAELYDSRDLGFSGGFFLEKWLKAPPVRNFDLIGQSGCDFFIHVPADNSLLLVWGMYSSRMIDVGAQNRLLESCSNAMEQLSGILGGGRGGAPPDSWSDSNGQSGIRCS
ncbi:DUF2357 domain-containing protein [bacterium]|nr:DUF2357 domain-containing protein [bacterium]